MKWSVSVNFGIRLGMVGALVIATSTADAVAADPPFAGAAAGAAAAKATAPLALEADGVSFGMNTEGVAKLYDAWWDKQFVPKYRKAEPGPRTRELDYELAEKKKVLRRITTFDGRSTADKSDFTEEFAHDNGESMTSARLVRRVGAGSEAKSVPYTRRFFFFQNRLWKTYDEYRLEARGPLGADFKEATAKVEASLGAAAKRTRGPESKLENVVFEAGATRVRVVKLPSNRVAVVRSDNALTREVLDRRAAQVQTATNELDSDIQDVIR